jgi:hypothetical protein
MLHLLLYCTIVGCPHCASALLLVAGYEQPDPSWSSSVEAWGHLSPVYLEVLNTRGAGIVQGWHFLTAICEGALYTQYLRQVRRRECPEAPCARSAWWQQRGYAC